jgi:glycosyltransferase involved in cell wall biosynthesis
MVAGDGPLLGELQSMARRIGVEGSVAFLGTVRNMPALYARIDVLVIPSHSEGLPNVLLEAIGAGVPVVATSVGAIPEVLTDDRVGIIVPPGDPRAIAEAIGAAYALRSRPDAASAFQETASAFSVARRVEHHLRLYREVLEGAEAGRQTSS